VVRRQRFRRPNRRRLPLTNPTPHSLRLATARAPPNRPTAFWIWAQRKRKKRKQSDTAAPKPPPNLLPPPPLPPPPPPLRERAVVVGPHRSALHNHRRRLKPTHSPLLRVKVRVRVRARLGLEGAAPATIRPKSRRTAAKARMKKTPIVKALLPLLLLLLLVLPSNCCHPPQRRNSSIHLKPPPRSQSKRRWRCGVWCLVAAAPVWVRSMRRGRRRASSSFRRRSWAAKSWALGWCNLW
jgi:hypothetical protein